MLGFPALALTTAVFLLLGKAARGDAPDAASRRHVRVVVAGPADDAATLKTSLHELLLRVGAELEFERVSRAEASAPTVDGAHRDFATVGVDLEAEGETRVVVADARGDVRMHKSVPRGSDKRVALEEASHVVQAAVEALGEEADEAAHPRPPAAALGTHASVDGGADVGHAAVAAAATAISTSAPTSAVTAPPAPTAPIVPPPIPAPLAKPPAAPATSAATTAASAAPAKDAVVPSSPKLGLDIFAAFELAGDGPGSGIVLGGAAGAVVHAGIGAYRPALWLFGEYHGAFTASEGSTSLDVTTVSVRTLPAIDLVRARTWRFEAAVGGGIDVFAVSPRRSNGATNVVHLASARSDVDPIVTAMIAAHTEIAGSIDAFAALRLDADLAPPRYESVAAGTSTTVFDPWRFRPALLLGVSWGLVGPSEYPARAEDTP